MARNLTTKDPYGSRAAGLLNSVVHIKSPVGCITRNIPSNRKLGVYIHRNPPSIKDDRYSKVAQITNEDRFFFRSD
jgi:hypothetical protein